MYFHVFFTSVVKLADWRALYIDARINDIAAGPPAIAITLAVNNCVSIFVRAFSCDLIFYFISLQILVKENVQLFICMLLIVVITNTFSYLPDPSGLHYEGKV